MLNCIIVGDSARWLLRQQGMTVAGVSCAGAKALRLVEQLRPGVALVDVGLGAESGLELAGRPDEVRPRRAASCAPAWDLTSPGTAADPYPKLLSCGSR